MKKHLSIALAAVLLAAGASGVMAAGYSSSSSSATKPRASTTMSKPRTNGLAARPGAKDTLSLASNQQHKAWNDLKGQSSNQNAPSGFQATIGSAVPSNVKIAPVPSKAATDVPALKPYDFAMVSGKLLIVNPSDKKIVDVITG
jgi:Protein of unknown function (DUF1236)